MPITLVLGGARSGKSRLAEGLAKASGRPLVYVATATAGDEEMAARITAHRNQRGPGWTTLEAPVDLTGTLRTVSAPSLVLVDCLTLWLTNLLLQEADMEAASKGLTDHLQARADDAPVILVANEIGLGIVPDNALARRFRDAAGRLNQQVAAVADRVIFTAAGLPLTLKGPPLDTP